MNTDDTHGGDVGQHCWLCSLPSDALENHTMDAAIFDRTRCANNDDSRVEVQLCPMCHRAVHRWMQANGHATDHPAAAAVDAIFHRFTDALLGTEKTDKKGRERP